MKFREGSFVSKDVQERVCAIVGDFNNGMMKLKAEFAKAARAAAKFGENMRIAESDRKKEVKRKRWAKR